MHHWENYTTPIYTSSTNILSLSFFLICIPQKNYIIPKLICLVFSSLSVSLLGQYRSQHDYLEYKLQVVVAENVEEVKNLRTKMDKYPLTRKNLIKMEKLL